VAQNPIDRLVRFYRNAIKQLARDLVGEMDLAVGGRARSFALAQNALALLKELDAETERWALRNVPQLYRAAQSDTVRRLRRFGLLRRDVQATAAAALINRAAIEALIADPERGVTSILRNATNEVRSRIKTIRDQAKVLRQHQKLINETIARVGVLEGRSINDVRDEIVRELSGLKRANELVWRPRLNGTGNTILRNMAELPYVKFPRTDGGVKNVRIDDYAEMVTRTKSRQAQTLGRRNKLLQHGQGLIRVTTNKPLEDDACSMYIGRAFALSESAKNEWGVPHVNELPAGGAPFHPNCTHNEIGFFPEVTAPDVLELALVSPPSWALNKTWNEVDREFKLRGGVGNIAQLNPAGDKFGKTTGGRQRRGKD
jgi:hypothetical protein